MAQGRELLNAIRACRPPEGGFSAWWFGQMGWTVKAGGLTIGIDLFLSPHPKRRYAALIAPEEAEGFDLFLGTHDHKDHIDREAWPAMAKASPGATFILPARCRAEVEAATGIAPDRFVAMDDGMTSRHGEVAVAALPSAHEWLDNDPAAGGNRWLGYVIEAGRGAIYHSGDTCNWEGLQTRLSRWRLLAAMLPINGRDAARFRAGVIGCLTYQEAGDLAGILGVGAVFPGHYDAFERDALDPALFADYVASRYPRTAARIPALGERVDILPES